MHPSRREFLSWSAAATAAAWLPPTLKAQIADSEPLSLGYSLYGMKTLALPAALAACARIGYRNVELCLAPGFPSFPAHFSPADRKIAGQRAKDLGLKVSAAMNDMKLFANPGGQAANLESIKTAAGVLRDVGADRNIPLESVLGGKPADWEKEKGRAVEQLQAWGEVAGREGTLVAIKAHAGMAVDTPEKLRWLLDQAASPYLGINFDQSHFALAHASVEDGLRLLSKDIKVVAVKEATGTLLKPRYLLPGDGHTDFTRYFEQLITAGYRGPLLVEVSVQIFSLPGYDPIATAERCHRALAGAVRTANRFSS